MKNFRKTLSAIIAAGMIFGTMAMPVYADKLKVTDGIIYKYDDNSNLIGEFSGWATTDGVSRRYIDGKPYTGWLKNNDGTYKYVLDGYLVKGEMPIKNKVYTFDENGIMTGQKKAVLSVDHQKNDVTEPLEFYITPLAYGEYGYGDPILERFENGEWVDCIGDCIEHESLYFESKISFQDCEQEVHIYEFPTRKYIGSETTLDTFGTYRLTLKASKYNTDGQRENFNVYCIFEITE